MTSMPPSGSADAPASRALFYAPEIAFDRPVARVPAAVFREQRDLAFAPDAETGLIDCSIADELGCSWAATTPTMLARYAVVRAGTRLGHSLQSTGEVYYVVRGCGRTTCAGDAFEWACGDAFCLPGGKEVEHSAHTDAILLQVTNEPELNYLRAAPAGSDILPTLYSADAIRQHLRQVHGRNGEQLAAGKSVVFLTAMMAERRVTTPTLLASINSLEAGGDQRPHRHSSTALTLCIEGEGTYSVVDGERVEWMPDTLFVTPPGAVHSHHNRGERMMRSFVVQDTGLHTELRTTNFAWAEAAACR